MFTAANCETRWRKMYGNWISLTQSNRSQITHLVWCSRYRDTPVELAFSGIITRGERRLPHSVQILTRALSEPWNRRSWSRNMVPCDNKESRSISPKRTPPPRRRPINNETLWRKLDSFVLHLLLWLHIWTRGRLRGLDNLFKIIFINSEIGWTTYRELFYIQTALVVNEIRDRISVLVMLASLKKNFTSWTRQSWLESLENMPKAMKNVPQTHQLKVTQGFFKNMMSLVELANFWKLALRKS